MCFGFLDDELSGNHFVHEWEALMLGRHRAPDQDPIDTGGPLHQTAIIPTEGNSVQKTLRDADFSSHLWPAHGIASSLPMTLPNLGEPNQAWTLLTPPDT